MKSLYESITNILTNDSDLKAMAKYTETVKTIRRAYTPKGKWDSLVIFYFQPETVMTDFTPMIRTVPLIIRVYDRESDIACMDMSERTILLLDGADLSISGKVHCYDCSYAGELSEASYVKELSSYEKILRFEVVVRQIAIAGKSGYPTRKRMREW